MALSNSYNDLTFIDRAGQVSRIASLSTTVLVKMVGRWQIVVDRRIARAIGWAKVQ